MSTMRRHHIIPTSLLVVSLAVLGCSADGGGSTPSNDNGDASEITDAQEDTEEVSVYDPEADLAAALDTLNARRVAIGFEPVELDDGLSAGCAAHVAYMEG